MSATGHSHHSSTAGIQQQEQHNESTMLCLRNTSTDTTVMSNTVILSESSNNSVVSHDVVSSISKEELSYYTDITPDEVASPVQNWKDDGDDSVCTSIADDNVDNEDCDDCENDMEHGAQNCGLHRIPSTLEFTRLEGKTDGEGEQQQEQPLDSPTSLSYSHHSPSRMLRMEMIQKDDDGFPSIPVLSMPSGGRIEKIYSKDLFHYSSRGCVDVEKLATRTIDATNTEQRNSFRRRLHGATDGRSTGTNPRQDSLSSSSALSRSNVFSRSRPRFVLMFGAMVLVMLSIHDSINHSRQYYRRQYQLLSTDINNRREEIAFPLGKEVQFHSERTETSHQAAGHNGQGEDNLINHHQTNVELPRFFFPKLDQPKTNWIRGSSSSSSSSISAGRPGSNLAMARSPPQKRPIFVPDTPLPDGGFRKPLERFVFDSQQQQRREFNKDNNQQQQHHGFDNDDYSSSSSWTSWMASLTLIGMLLDTGWKEYRRTRIAAISSSRDE